jgi:hypothetical protein
VTNYHRSTLGLQNPDGSVSTTWLVGREAREDLDRRLQTSGHILEWLNYSLPDAELTDPRVVKAVEYVTGILDKQRNHEWKIGHLGHALRALSLYDRRVFKPYDPPGDVAWSAARAAANGSDPPPATAAQPRVLK